MKWFAAQFEGSWHAISNGDGDTELFPPLYTCAINRTVLDCAISVKQSEFVNLMNEAEERRRKWHAKHSTPFKKGKIWKDELPVILEVKASSLGWLVNVMKSAV